MMIGTIRLVGALVLGVVLHTPMEGLCFDASATVATRERRGRGSSAGALSSPPLPTKHPNGRTKDLSSPQPPPPPPPSSSSSSHLMPMPLLIGLEDARQSLLLGLVDPSLHCLLVGKHGTGKTQLARSLARISPTIRVAKGTSSPGRVGLNLEPEEGEEWEERPLPFVDLPLNTMEDRLFGGVDVEESLRLGHPVFNPGLLARAHRGVVYVDDINLLDPSVCESLLQALDSGTVRVEREGISVVYPCRPLLIASCCPEEAPLRGHLVDRFASVMNCDIKLPMEDRIAAALGNELWADGQMESPIVREALREEERLHAAVQAARSTLKDRRLAPEQIRYICAESTRAGCRGQRGEIFAASLARASAALNGHMFPTASDLRLGVRLAIAPRAESSSLESENPLLPPNRRSSLAQQALEKDESSRQDAEEEKKTPSPENGASKAETGEEEDDEVEGLVPPYFIFGAAEVDIDKEILGVQSTAMRVRGKSPGGGSGKKIFSKDRGRYVKPVFRGPGTSDRIAVDATLRAAAPHQLFRRRKLANELSRQVVVEKDDIRVKKLARKSGSLVIFCVDCSGSMALNRMEAAKGAALNLLSQAYVRRDQVALIAVQGESASLLLPPTRSVTSAKRSLEYLPCGGGTPTAHALTLAVRCGLTAKKRGSVQRLILVYIGDGRANVPLNRSLEQVNSANENSAVDLKALAENREEILEETLQLCEAAARLGFEIVSINTETSFVSIGISAEMARRGRGSYVHIPRASSGAIQAALKQLSR